MNCQQVTEKHSPNARSASDEGNGVGSGAHGSFVARTFYDELLTTDLLDQLGRDATRPTVRTEALLRRPAVGAHVGRRRSAVRRARGAADVDRRPLLNGPRCRHHSPVQ